MRSVPGVAVDPFRTEDAEAVAVLMGELAAFRGALARDLGSAACRRMTVGAEPDNEGANSFHRGMGFEVHRPAACRYRISDDALDRLATG